MQQRGYRKWAGLLLCSSLCLSQPVQADDYEELDERLRSIESQMPQASGGGVPGMAEDIQRLQQEVRELRGEIERLQYESEQARIRQRDMNLDIEKRLSALEKGAKPAAGQGVQSKPPVQTPAGPASATPPAAESTTPAGSAETDESTPEVVQEQNSDAPDEGETPTPEDSRVVLNEQDEYLKAFELLKQGSYDESITAFQGFLQNFPNGNYADNARYWLAETHYVKKDYSTALTHFEKLIAEYPNSSKLPGALLKIGYIQYETGNYAEARLALERVRNEFSGSNVADLATQRLERLDREGR